MTAKLTLEAFAEFCESKPADEAYPCSGESKNEPCACNQFDQLRGIPYDSIPAKDEAARRAIGDHCWSAQPRTFGALAELLRAAIAASEGR